MKKTLLKLLIASFALFSITSCHKHDENDEELITTVIYKLTPASGGTTATFSFKDLDGDGGNPPVISVSPLKSNTIYKGELTLLNESQSPTDDITLEIKEEAKDHQFFFESSLVKVKYADKDGDGNPIGLTTELTTTNAGTGKLKITLRHEPNKKANGVKDGLIANAGGETDLEIEFNITVQQ